MEPRPLEDVCAICGDDGDDALFDGRWPHLHWLEGTGWLCEDCNDADELPSGGISKNEYQDDDGNWCDVWNCECGNVIDEDGAENNGWWYCYECDESSGDQARKSAEPRRDRSFPPVLAPHQPSLSLVQNGNTVSRNTTGQKKIF